MKFFRLRYYDETRARQTVARMHKPGDQLAIVNRRLTCGRAPHLYVAADDDQHLSPDVCRHPATVRRAAQSVPRELRSSSSLPHGFDLLVRDAFSSRADGILLTWDGSIFRDRLLSVAPPLGTRRSSCRGQTSCPASGQSEVRKGQRAFVP